MKPLVLVVILACLMAVSCNETYVNGPLELTDPGVLPTLLWTSPPMNSLGPYDYSVLESYSSVVQLRFNKFMDPASVRRSISGQSTHRFLKVDSTSVSGNFESYSFSFSDSGGHYYDAFHGSAIGERVSFRVTQSAKDVNGNFLRNDVEVFFIPEPYLRVVSVYPYDGVIAGMYVYLDIFFNAMVDSSVLPYLSLDPPTAGRWSIYGKSTHVTYIFDPGPLPDSLELRIAEGLRDVDKNVLWHSFRKVFRAEHHFQPYNSSSYHVSVNDSISMLFTEPLDTSTIAAAFSINPRISGSLFVTPSGLLKFAPDHDLMEGTDYSITIDTSIRSSFGSTLSQPFTFIVRTRLIAPYALYPNQGEIMVPISSIITMGFTAWMDTVSIVNAFSISPPVSGVIRGSPYRPGREFTFTPSFNLSPSTVYTITISTDVQTPRGTHMSTPYYFSFKTSP